MIPLTVLLIILVGFVIADITLLRRWRGGWRVVAALPLVALVAWAIVIIASILRDPTSHNLWPMELSLWCAGGYLWLGLLALARRLLRRSRSSQ